MNLSHALAAAAATALGLAGGARAQDCAEPASSLQPPASGRTISLATLNEYGEAVVAFDAELSAYGACLLTIVDNREKHTPEVWSHALLEYNQIAGDKDQAWDGFMRLSREWREANAVRAKATQ